MRTVGKFLFLSSRFLKMNVFWDRTEGVGADVQVFWAWEKCREETWRQWAAWPQKAVNVSRWLKSICLVVLLKQEWTQLACMLRECAFGVWTIFAFSRWAGLACNVSTYIHEPFEIHACGRLCSVTLFHLSNHQLSVQSLSYCCCLLSTLLGFCP